MSFHPPNQRYTMVMKNTWIETYQKLHNDQTCLIRVCYDGFLKPW
jgi:hypothetical protein